MKWKIGNIEINYQVVLAPMAGISNPSFMRICEEMGIGYAVTELISSEAIIRGNKKTFEMLNGLDKLTIPVAVQLFGSNPDTMAQAAKILVNKYNIKIIDINMGCPVPKVAIRSEAGSALMKNLKKVFDIVSRVVESVSVPVTVKIRSGWDKDSINAKEIAKICEQAGASAIAVHARTRSQGYSGKADWNVIKEVKEAVSIPIIGNGDIVDVESAKRMLDETNCDAIMIGRGLLGNPWLIREINEYSNNNIIINPPTDVEKIDMAIHHLNNLLEDKSEHLACLEFRTIVSYYLKGIVGSKEVKEKIFKTFKVCDIISVLNEFKEELCNQQVIKE